VSVVASGPGASKSFAYVLGVYLGDGAVTLWRMEGKSDRLVFRLNTIDEDFAKATRAALADLERLQSLTFLPPSSQKRKSKLGARAWR